MQQQSGSSLFRLESYMQEANALFSSNILTNFVWKALMIAYHTCTEDVICLQDHIEFKYVLSSYIGKTFCEL